MGEDDILQSSEKRAIWYRDLITRQPFGQTNASLEFLKTMASNSSFKKLNLPTADLRALTDLISASADLTMVVDAENVVGDLSHNLQNVPNESLLSWRGQQIDEVVKHDSLSTLKAMLRSARTGKPTTGYEIGHRLENGEELPLKYSASHIGSDGQVVLMARDLRPTISLQSRLLSNRQSLEANKRRQRQSETRYRLLFETISDAILIVDVKTGTIREANPRAAALLESRPADLGGKKLASAFETSQRTAIRGLIASVAASGTTATLETKAVGNRLGLSLSAELFRSDEEKLVLVRITPSDAELRSNAPLDVGLGDLVRNASEAVLLIDENGTVDWANESFLTLSGIPLAAQVVGRPLEAFLQWHGIEQGTVLDKVRRHGRMPMVSAAVRSTDGHATEVETSVVARTAGQRDGYALVMRPLSDANRPSGRSATGDMTRLPDGLTDMIGRVPMKDLVRDTTDIIERMCIEAALKLANNNRASAARALGLSRQALYLKLRRYGIAEEE